MSLNRSASMLLVSNTAQLYVYMHVYKCVCVQRPEVKVRCFFNPSLPYFG